MFERFTEIALRVIMLAQEEAISSRHYRVGAEQILLGLLAVEKGLAYRALTERGMTLELARAEVTKILGPGSDPIPDNTSDNPPPFTPRAKRILELTWDSARQLNHNFIASEHLLLGSIREGEGVQALVCQNLGIDLDVLKEDLLELIRLSLR